MTGSEGPDTGDPGSRHPGLHLRYPGHLRGPTRKGVCGSTPLLRAPDAVRFGGSSSVDEARHSSTSRGSPLRPFRPHTLSVVSAASTMSVPTGLPARRRLYPSSVRLHVCVHTGDETDEAEGGSYKTSCTPRTGSGAQDPPARHSTFDPHTPCLYRLRSVRPPPRAPGPGDTEGPGRTRRTEDRDTFSSEETKP